MLPTPKENLSKIYAEFQVDWKINEVDQVHHLQLLNRSERSSHLASSAESSADPASRGALRRDKSSMETRLNDLKTAKKHQKTLAKIWLLSQTETLKSDLNW